MPPRPRNSMAIAVTEAAPAFAALGDATRLHIVLRLSRDGPLSISRLTDDARITRQAITKHLQALERARLVSSQRAGRERLWQLRQKGLHDARRHLDQIAAEWDRALGRLRLLVEGSKS
jgi:DNA-binding transcriptional ArsR family regulator